MHSYEFVSDNGFKVRNAATGVETEVINSSGEIKGDIKEALAQGSVYIGNSSGITSELSVKGDGKIVVGNGTTATSVSVSGDATLSNAGVLTIGNDKITTAKILDANVTTGKLADNAVTPAKLDEKAIQYAEVAISAADIVATEAGKLGHAEGYELVAAPATGKALELISAVLIYDYDTAAYTDGGNITVNWGGGGAAITGLVSAANSLGAAADKVVQLVPLSTAGNAMSVATALHLVSSAAFTNPGTAAGVVRVKVAYRVHTTDLA